MPFEPNRLKRRKYLGDTWDPCDLLRRHAGNAWDPQTYFADMPVMLGTHDLLRELPQARKGTRCSAQACRHVPAPVRSVTRRLGRQSNPRAGFETRAEIRKVHSKSHATLGYLKPISPASVRA